MLVDPKLAVHLTTHTVFHEQSLLFSTQISTVHKGVVPQRNPQVSAEARLSLLTRNLTASLV